MQNCWKIHCRPGRPTACSIPPVGCVQLLSPYNESISVSGMYGCCCCCCCLRCFLHLSASWCHAVRVTPDCGNRLGWLPLGILQQSKTKLVDLEGAAENSYFRRTSFCEQQSYMTSFAFSTVLPVTTFIQLHTYCSIFHVTVFIIQLLAPTSLI